MISVCGLKLKFQFLMVQIIHPAQVATLASTNFTMEQMEWLENNRKIGNLLVMNVVVFDHF